MSSITLSPNTRTMLQEAEKFLTRDIEILKRETTLFAKVLSWMPLANLVITHRTLEKIEISYARIANLLINLADGEGSQRINIENTENWLSPRSAVEDAKADRFTTRLWNDQSNADKAKQYFFQTLLVVATVAIAFFGSSLAAGASLVVGAAVLHKTIGLNYWPSNIFRERNTVGTIGVAQTRLKEFQYILSLDSSTKV